MTIPGSGLGKAPGTGAAENGENGAGTKEMQLEGKDLKIPSSKYLQELIVLKLDFFQLKLKLEKDFPGYTLPNKDDIGMLKLREEHKNLRKLVEGLSFPGNRFNIFSCDGGKFNRSRWLISGDSLGEEHIDSNDKAWPHLREDDLIFLIKKETH